MSRRIWIHFPIFTIHGTFIFWWFLLYIMILNKSENSFLFLARHYLNMINELTHRVSRFPQRKWIMIIEAQTSDKRVKLFWLIFERKNWNEYSKEIEYKLNIHLDLASCALACCVFASCGQISVLYEVSPNHYIYSTLQVAFC